MNTMFQNNSHDSMAWRHLPSYMTMNQFLAHLKEATQREKKPSDTLFKSILSLLDYTSKNPDLSIYNDIYPSRIEQSAEDLASKTMPRLIAWETTELLTTLFSIRDSNKNVDAEQLASQTLEALARTLSESMFPQNVACYGFKELHMLSNSGIQQKMLSAFEPNLQQRFNVIHSIIFGPGREINADCLVSVLEQLDALIAAIKGTASQTANHHATDIKRLYMDLLSVRKELLNPKALENGNIEKLNWRKDASVADLVLEIKTKLYAASRDPSIEDVSSFLASYQKYLELAIDPDVKASALEFENKYIYLKRYLTPNSTIDQFRNSVRNELYQFARQVFIDLDYLYTATDTSSSFIPNTAEVAFARSMTANVHTRILNKIHEPLRLLCSVYSFFFFAGDNPDVGNPEKLQGVTRLLMLQRQSLIQSVPEIPAIKQGDYNSIKSFIDIYTKYAAPIWGQGFCTYDNITSALQWIADGTYGCYTTQLFATANLLSLECRLFVAMEIEKEIPIIVDVYPIMKDLLTT